MYGRWYVDCFWLMVVQNILKYCNMHKIPVCIQGGNTGLVGGSAPINDEVIVSMHKMNKILDFNEGTAVASAEAGAVLQTVDEYVRDRGYIMPLDLGAKGRFVFFGFVDW